MLAEDLTDGKFFGTYPELLHVPEVDISTITAEYLADPSSLKVDLGTERLHDACGNLWVPKSFVKAQNRLVKQGLMQSHLPILGHADFRRLTAQAVLGVSGFQKVRSKISSCHCLSGSGAFYLAAQVIARCHCPLPKVLIPSPVWADYAQTFESAGFKCHISDCYDTERKGFDTYAYLNSLQIADTGSVVLLHATGHELSEDQWREIGRFAKEKHLLPVFDGAHLGLNSGSFDNDTFAIRHFINDLELEVVVCVSFSTSMGLYCERVGCLLVCSSTEERANNCLSTLVQLQDEEIITPPTYGVQIAQQILRDKELARVWAEDLATVNKRIRHLRRSLYEAILDQATPGHWKHIPKQSGMFSFLGLAPDVIKELRKKYHIYMPEDSRICIAGLNEGNIVYIASSIAACIRNALLG